MNIPRFLRAAVLTMACALPLASAGCAYDDDYDDHHDRDWRHDRYRDRDWRHERQHDRYDRAHDDWHRRNERDHDRYHDREHDRDRSGFRLPTPPRPPLP